MKETKIYVVPASEVEEPHMHPDHSDFKKEDFMQKAKELGTVFSVSGFQAAFNNSEINVDNDFIFIDHE